MLWWISILFVLLFEGKENITLEDLRWKNRIVLYFPPRDQNPQINLDSLESELKERKIIFLSIGKNFETNSKKPFHQEYLKILREKFSLKSDLSNWVLIGLDGGTKLKREGNLDWDFIFKTIDAMPMRQSEIRDGK